MSLVFTFGGGGLLEPAECAPKLLDLCRCPGMGEVGTMPWDKREAAAGGSLPMCMTERAERWHRDAGGRQ